MRIWVRHASCFFMVMTALHSASGNSAEPGDSNAGRLLCLTSKGRVGTEMEILLLLPAETNKADEWSLYASTHRPEKERKPAPTEVLATGKLEVTPDAKRVPVEFQHPGEYQVTLVVRGKDGNIVKIETVKMTVESEPSGHFLQAVSGPFLGAIAAVLVFLAQGYVTSLSKTKAQELHVRSALKGVCQNMVLLLESRRGDAELLIPETLALPHYSEWAAVLQKEPQRSLVARLTKEVGMFSAGRSTWANTKVEIERIQTQIR